MTFILSLSASTFAPCILLLHSIHALGKDKERNVEGKKHLTLKCICFKNVFLLKIVYWECVFSYLYGTC